jgi:hypothetical protein
MKQSGEMRSSEERPSSSPDFVLQTLLRSPPPRRRRPLPQRPASQPPWLFAASVACALVSLVSAGVAHVQAGAADVTMPQEEAIRTLRTLEDRQLRLAAIESLRRHAIQAVRRLEMTRDVDIFVGDHAAEALASIQQELQR